MADINNELAERLDAEADSIERGVRGIKHAGMRDDARAYLALLRDAAAALRSAQERAETLAQALRDRRVCFEGALQDVESFERSIENLKAGRASIGGYVSWAEPMLSMRRDLLKLAIRQVDDALSSPEAAPAAACGKTMRGYYGALTSCARPAGHRGPCHQVHDPREFVAAPAKEPA